MIGSILMYNNGIIFSRYNSWDKVGGFLFGNGLSIGVTFGDAFCNGSIMEEFNKLLIDKEKFLVDDVLEFMQWYLFEYFDDFAKKAFLYQVSKFHLDMETANKIRHIELTQNLINLHIFLFNNYKSKDDLGSYSIEQLQVFENIYHNFIKNSTPGNIAKYSLKNSGWEYRSTIKYADYFKSIIKIIQNDSKISRKLLVDQFENKKIFTTNYDTILDSALENVIHLHGSIDDNIITGAEYFIKALQLSTTGKYQTKYDFIYNHKIQELLQVRGTLCIVGYSCNYNDEHIHQAIRANGKIDKIIYFAMEEDYFKLTQDSKRRNYLCKCLGIDGVSRELYIEDANVFYDRYAYSV